MRVPNELKSWLSLFIFDCFLCPMLVVALLGTSSGIEWTKKLLAAVVHKLKPSSAKETC